MRSIIIISVLSVFLSNFVFTQETIKNASANIDLTPVVLVQKQLEAYNERDIDPFMAVFHEEISLWELNASSPSVSGFEAVKEVYNDLFEASPELHSEVVNRSTIGKKVLDYELVTGIRGSDETMTLIMVYEIKGGKIWKATAIRP